jgi:glucodextranase-like protein
VLIVAFAGSLLVMVPRVAGGVGEGLGELATSLANSIPLLQGSGAIDLPAGAGATVGAAPVVLGLPTYTRQPQLQLTGRVPAFAVRAGRELEVVLNGAVVARNPLAENGGFGIPIALKEGLNEISVILVDDGGPVASTTHNVIVDRAPPPLEIGQPQGGAVVDARNVIVEGISEPGATVSVNGRTVVVNSDGAFADALSAAPGTLAITVVSRDRAGNETTQALSVTAREVTTSSATLTVALDRTTVRPSQYVLATITLRDGSGPKARAQVSLTVGVVPIASATTDATGTAKIGFYAPANEGVASVVVLTAGASGRATLTIAR